MSAHPQARRSAVVAAVLLIGLSLAGCGDDTKTASTATRPDPAPQTETGFSAPAADALRGVSFEVRRDPG